MAHQPIDHNPFSKTAGFLAKVAKAGRQGDSVLAHLRQDDLVIPEELQHDPQVKALIQILAKSTGMDLERFRVGGKDNRFNPKTGLREFEGADSGGGDGGGGDSGGGADTGGGADVGSDSSGGTSAGEGSTGGSAADIGAGAGTGGTGIGGAEAASGATSGGQSSSSNAVSGSAGYGSGSWGGDPGPGASSSAVSAAHSTEPTGGFLGLGNVNDPQGYGDRGFGAALGQGDFGGFGQVTSGIDVIDSALNNPISSLINTAFSAVPIAGQINSAIGLANALGITTGNPLGAPTVGSMAVSGYNSAVAGLQGIDANALGASAPGFATGGGLYAENG